MELFNWKKLNNKLCYVNIKKKFFNKYFYSAKYFCPGARIILQPQNDSIEAILNAVAARRITELTFQSRLFSPWYQSSDSNYLRDKEKIIPQQLFDILILKTKRKLDIKIRIEEPYVTLYAEHEEDLFKIASHDLVYCSDRLESVSRPESDSVKNLLDNNNVLIKKDIGYKYKFICKEGIYQNKLALYSYLDQLDDAVKVSKTNWTQLESTRRYIRNLWIYTNDINLAPMLNLIEVNVVRNIHELVIAPTK
jgi:hypothetical protein